MSEKTVLESTIAELQQKSEKTMAEEVEKEEIRENMSPWEGLGRGFGDVLSFGNMDDMMGTLSSLSDIYRKAGFGGFLNPAVIRDSRQAGEATKLDQQGRSEDAKKGYPGLYMTGQAGGILAPVIIPGGGQAYIARILALGIKDPKAWAMATSLGVTVDALTKMGSDKFAENPMKAITDGTLWGIGGWAMGGIGNRVAPPVLDFIKRQFGSGLGNKAKDMLADAMARGNQTPDQAIVSVIKQMRKDGLSPVEASKDLTDMIDNLANTNPAVMKLVKSLIEGDELFQTSKLKSILQKDLAPGTTPTTNIDSYFNAILKNITENQKQRYKKVFGDWVKNGNAPPQDLINAVHHVLKNDEKFANLMLGKIKRNKLLENEPDYNPINDFFKRDAKGRLVFTEAPNLNAMETMRRALGNRASKIFKNQSEELDVDDANIFDTLEKSLRTKIDDASESLAKKGDETMGGARKATADEKFALEQYEEGRKILSKGNQDVEATMNYIQKVADSGNEQAIKYLKLGLMNRLNNMFAKASVSASNTNTDLDKFLVKLGKEGSSERLIYEALFPGVDIKGTMKTAKRALEARRVSGSILGGSQTARRMTGGLSVQKGNLMGNVAEAVVDTATLGAPVRTLFNKMKSLSGKYKGQMSEQEMLNLTRFALSKNPDYVERVLAMKDKDAFEAISRLGSRFYGTAPVTVGMLGSSSEVDPSGIVPRMF